MGVMVKDGLGPAGPGGWDDSWNSRRNAIFKAELSFWQYAELAWRSLSCSCRGLCGRPWQDTELSKKSRRRERRLCIGYVERSVRKLHLTAGLSHLLFSAFSLVLKGSPLAKLIILSYKTQDGQSEFRAS